jgi:hypothetical protein
MKKIVDAYDIISLFGKTVDSPEVEALFLDLETMNRPQPDYENEDYFDWVMVRRQGVELGFSGVLYHEGTSENFWGERDELALYQAYFYTAFDDVKTFQGELPFGLKFSDSREIARQKLSAYESSRHSYITDTWDANGFRLNIRYAKGFRSIDSMACIQEWLPILHKEPVIYPELSQIIKAFGSTVESPEFTGLWNKETVDEIHDLVLNEGMRSAFLNRSYGVDMSFSREGKEKQFYAITLLGNRQIDSVNWEGVLPFDLSFDDSPETMFDKMKVHKKSPDERSDTMKDNTDYAVWHFQECTLSILYSHLDNRILRVSMYAPGVWQSFKSRRESWPLN